MEYVYKSTEERVYADRGLVANFSDVVDWPDDGHWVPTEETAVELERLAAEKAAAEAAQAKTPAPGEQQKSTETPPGESSPTDPPTDTAPTRGGRKTTKE